MLVSHTTRSVPLNPVSPLKGILDRAIGLADKFNLAGRIHRRDAEFAEVFMGSLGARSVCASAVNH